MDASQSKHGDGLAARLAAGSIDLHDLEHILREVADDLTAPCPLRLARFEIRAQIGAGGMGVVYRAFDPTLNREVAIKVLGHRSFASTHERARFAREARVLARLRHPSIVPLHEIGQDDSGVQFLVLELVEGSSLAAVAATNTGRDQLAGFRRIATLLAQVARALHYAHGEGVVHRDVKPSNILLDARDRPILIDFGLGHLVSSDASATRSAAGTAAYMAPEQVEGGEIGATTDVYGLGATLYHLLAAVPPFSGNDHAVREQVRSHDPRPPCALNRAVPRDLQSICLRALAKAPGERYTSAAAMAADLDAFAEDRAVAARPLRWPLRVAHTMRRNKLRTAVAVLVAAIVIGGPISWALHEQDAVHRLAIEHGLTKAALAEVERQRSAIQRAIATEQMAVGRLAFQRGHWAEALAAYDRAEATGEADAALIALGRVEAHEGSLQPAAALAVLEKVQDVTDPKLRARFELLRADLDVNRLRDPEAKLDLVRTALPHLDGAHRLLAESMLAATVPHALQLLARAHTIEPYNRRVNDSYLTCLLAAGRLRAAAEFARRMHALFPADISTRSGEVFLRAALGEVDEAQRLLDDIRAAGDDDQAELARFLFDAGEFVREARGVLLHGTISRAGPSFGEIWRLLGGVVPRMIGLLSRYRSTFGDDSRARLFYRLPPAVARAMVPLVLHGPKLLVPTTAMTDAELHATIIAASEGLGDALYWQVRGLLAAGRGDDAEMLQAFAEATRHDSVIVSAQVGWAQLLWAKLLVSDRQLAHDDPAAEAARAELGGLIRATLDAGPPPAELLASLHTIASRVNLPVLALAIAERWSASAPSPAAATALADSLKRVRATAPQPR